MQSFLAAFLGRSGLVLSAPTADGTAGQTMTTNGSAVLAFATLGVAGGGIGITSGTSGGILGFTATGTLASSGLLTANGVLYGGGAGVLPSATAQGAANSILTANAGVPAFSATPIIQTSLQLGVVSSATGSLKLANLASANLTTITAGNAAFARTYVWPTNFGAAGGTLTDAAGDGTLSWAVPSSGLTVGTTTITSGTNTRILYDNAGVLGEYALTGTGTVAVMQTSPTLITPVLGIATGTSLALTSTSAAALVVGANGATDPALQVDCATVSSATGLKITSAAAAGGVALAVLSSGTNENLKLDAKGSGTIVLAATSTGNLSLVAGGGKVAIGSSAIVPLQNLQIGSAIVDGSSGIIRVGKKNGASFSDFDFGVGGSGYDFFIAQGTSGTEYIRLRFGGIGIHLANAPVYIQSGVTIGGSQATLSTFYPPPSNGLYVEGVAGFGARNSGAQIHITPLAAATKGLIVQGAASQTANLQEWQNSSGTILTYVNSAGNVGVRMGATASTAYLHIAAGTATASTAPLKFTSGTVNTTAESGAQEFNGNWYLTTSGLGGVRVRLGIGGTLDASTTQTGNTAATETNLFATTVKANALNVALDSLYCTAGGSFGAGASADKRLRAYLGTTRVFDSGALGVQSVNWTMNGTLIRVTSTSWKATFQLSTSSGTLAAYSYLVTGGADNLTTALTFKVTGVGTNANDVVGELYELGMLPAPSA